MNIWEVGIRAAKGVERMLEGGEKHDAWFSFKDVFSAITVMHIKVNNRYAFQTVDFHRMGGTNSDIIKHAKTSRFSACCMMTRWTNRTKSMFVRTSHDQINRHNNRASTMQGSIKRVWIHTGIAIKHSKTFFRRSRKHAVNVIRIMHADQVLTLCTMGVIVTSDPVYTRHDHPIVNGTQSLRAFRVMRCPIVM